MHFCFNICTGGYSLTVFAFIHHLHVCECLCYSTPGIRQLQLMLLKVSLILGVEVHVNVEFSKLVEPPAEQTDDSESVCVCVAVIVFVCITETFLNIENVKLNYQL